MKLEERDILFFDIESTGLDERLDKLHGVAWALNNEEVVYSPAWSRPQRLLASLADPKILKVGFNVRFDEKFLILAGHSIVGDVYDVMHMAQQVDENQPLGLKPLTARYRGEGYLSNKAELDASMETAGVKNIGAFCRIDLLDPAHPYLSVISKYGTEDTDNTRWLFWFLVNRLRKIDSSLRSILKVRETPLTNYLKDIAPTEPVLLDMELRGVRVNTARIDAVRADAEKRRDDLVIEMTLLCSSKMKLVEEDLTDKAIETHLKKLKTDKKVESIKADRAGHYVPFNWASGDHVGRLFFEKFNVPPGNVRKTKSGGYAMDETFLKNFVLYKNHPLEPVLKKYAAYKKTLKIIGTYTGTDKKGIVARIRKDEGGEPTIFALFPQMTDSGRLNPKRPNLANLPRSSPVKSFFIPRHKEKVFAYADWSQLQLRIAAHVSRDPVLVEAYRLDQDIHKRTASRMFSVPETSISDVQRGQGKTTNFASIFGAEEHRLLSEFKEKNGLDVTLDDCKRFKEAVRDDWKVYFQYLEKQLAFVRKYGFVISETGRVRRLPEIVFGNYLDWKRKVFTGPHELKLKLLEKEDGGRMPDDRELLYRANRKFRHAKNQAFCIPIQNLESSMMKRALVRLRKESYRIVNVVHDSILAEIELSEIERAKDDISRIMTTTYPLSVPLKADVKILRSFDEKDQFLIKKAIAA